MSNKRKFFLTKEQLEDLYINQFLSIYDIGKQYNINPKLVSSYLRQFNIKTRSRARVDEVFTKKN